jgi:hypothetical protein
MGVHDSVYGLARSCAKLHMTRINKPGEREMQLMSAEGLIPRWRRGALAEPRAAVLDRLRYRAFRETLP